jgi:hypothetical protein
VKHDLEVTIDEEGNVVLEAHGLQGRSCLPALNELVKALGKAGDPTPTLEMYVQTNTVKAPRGRK